MKSDLTPFICLSALLHGGLVLGAYGLYNQYIDPVLGSQQSSEQVFQVQFVHGTSLLPPSQESTEQVELKEEQQTPALKEVLQAKPIVTSLPKKNLYNKKFAIPSVKHKSSSSKQTVQNQDTHFPMGGTSTAFSDNGDEKAKGEPIKAAPDVIYNPPPSYPESARRGHHEGIVTLAIKVKSDGSLDSVSVKQSSGFESLDMAAFRTVQRWRFKPALMGGMAVASEVEVPVRFSLKEP